MAVLFFPGQSSVLKIPTLQGPYICRRERRAPPCAPKGKQASLTVEAALCLPLFLFFAVTLIQPMNWLDEQRKVQTALEAVCEDISISSFLMEKYGKARQEGDGQDTLEFVSDAAAGLYLKGKVSACADGIAVTKSELSDGQGNIRMEVKYLKKPLGVTMNAGGRRRAWTGINGKLRAGENTPDIADSDEEMVYVGENMGRYHLYRDCHYLSNQYEAMAKSAAANARNAYGKRYTACTRCAARSSSADEVYVTKAGEHYHADKNCSAMAAYVRRVPKSEVEYLGLCSYCAGKGGKP